MILPKIRKKLLVTIISLLFLTTGVVSSYANEINKSIEKTEEAPEENVQLSTVVTLYRHGVDGSIKPLNVNIKYWDNEDLGDAIAEKCEELFKNDDEFKDLENLSNIKLGFYSIVSSKGRGFHYQMALLGKLTIRYVLFRLGLPRVHSLFITPLIVCKYKNDPKAKTTIKSIILGGRTKEINGSHMVIAHNFIGITSWIGRFSFTPLNILPKSFFGIARFTFCLG